MESLEGRTYFALLGIPTDFPTTTALNSSTGSLTYTASTDQFSDTATPVTFSLNGAASVPVTAPRDFNINVLVDNSGDLVGPGTPIDLEIVGTINLSAYGGGTYSGVLLTGQMTQFGYAVSSGTGEFDARLTPTGGALESTYFAGQDIGLFITSEDSSFNGTFTSDFSGETKAEVGPIPLLTPTITTTAGASVVAGGSTPMTDTATLSGGYDETGNITFNLYNSSNAVVDTESVVVNGPGSYSTPTGYLPTVAGTYQWVATYSGDGTNASVASTLGSEPETALPAGPTITTTPSQTAVTLGASTVTLDDTATLSGGTSPTGSITFNLFYDGGLTPVDTETVGVSGDGSYTTPTGYTLPASGTVTGSYQWDAFYSGDSNNKPASDNNDPNETVTVSAANPTLVTTPNETSVTLPTSSVKLSHLGGSPVTLTDTALLSGGYDPTGSITFNLYYNGGLTPVDTETVTVNGDGSYTTPTGYSLSSATVTGSYQWDATYSGDTNNNAASDNNDPNETVTVNPASPSLSTTPSTSSVTLGTSVVTLTDTAVLSGGYDPTGTITFELFYNGGLTPVDDETVTVNGNNGSYSTPTGYTIPASMAAAGSYQWDATYSGDGNNNSASDDQSPSEEVQVNAASPSLITTPGSSVVIGSSGKLTDSALLSGGFSPTGTITFNLYSPTDTVVYTDIVTVTGNGTYTTASGNNPGGYTPSGTGTYEWVDTYSGDSNNNTVTSTSGSEPETVTAASPSIATTPGGTITIGSGSKLSDSATLSGGYSPTGTITFTLYNSGNTAVYADTVTISGNGTYTTASGNNSGGYLPTGTGTYEWAASYSGDSSNNSATSTSGSEPETVGAAGPSITTTPGGTIVIGSGAKLSDSATLSGGSSPTGTITFTLYNSASTAVYTDTVTISGNGTYTTASGTNSGGYLPTATGTYQWVASYGGDSNNGSVTSTLGSEPETVSSSSPSITTTPGGTIVIGSGSKLSDSATLSGGSSPTGTITFTLYNSASTAVYTDTVTVSGNGTYTTASGTNSGGYLPAATGTYQWVASYGGDSNNGSVTSTLGSEPETVSSSSPSITTTPGGTIVIGSGSKLSDSATLSGGSSPTGTITFTLYNSASTAVYTDTVTISGDGTYTTASGTNSGGYLPSATGTYQWVASYGGDSNNGSVTSTLGSEPETVSAASPSITTTPGGTIVLGSGSKLSDSATLSGGYSPTGSIIFTLYNSSNTAVYTDTVTITGDGTYTTASGNNSGGYLPTATGTYQWVASYGGDTNNKTVTSTLGSEPENVTSASPSITTTPGGTIVIGSSSKLSDSATLSGGSSPTGTITFTLYNPSSAVVYTDVVTITGDGTYTTASGSNSGGYAPTVTGTYQWAVTYSGDSNNASVSSTKGSEPESVCAASPSITTTPGGTVVIGSGTKLTDSATLSNGYNETGTVTFTLYNPSNTVVYTDVVTASGNGTYTTATGSNSGGYAPTATGTYQWAVTYSGDSNNASVSSAKGNEPETVTCGTPTLTTTPGGTITMGCNTKLTDSATLSGGSSPTGTITFTLYSPSNAVVYTDVVTITGDGTFTTSSGNNSGGYLPTATGTFQWVVTYSGNSTNASVTSPSGSEPECVVSGITITGTKYLDPTGNGFGSSDTPQSGVTIDLYEESNKTSGLQTGSGGDTLVATTITASNGTYSFTNLAPGTYYVQEVVPTGYIQTGGGPNGSAGDTYYTVTAAWDNTYANNNFADFLIPTCTPTNVCYSVDCNNSITTVTNLRGNTQQGDSVTVTFTVPAGMNDTLSLISYTAPSSTYSASTAYEQQPFDVATGTFAPGTHTLTVLLPNCYYQVDFVCGTVINPLVPTTGGPDSANITYAGEDRLISADNGGTQAYAAKAIASGTFGTAAYWTTSIGQTVIKSLNGSSTATALSQWLSTNFPNLYGVAAGAYALVNTNGTYLTNTQIASAYSKFTGAAEQVLSTVLSIYASSINLAGINVHSIDSHFTTSANGSAMETYNVGTNGAAFGLANNTTTTVMQLLLDLNLNTTAGSAPSSGANTVFTAINTAGGVST